MAKMSGGMGMPGMFAPPMGGAKKRPSGTREDKPHVEEGESATSPPPSQRMPMVPVPGMPPKPPARQTTTEVTKEPEAGVPLTAERAPEEVPDVEDLEQKPTAAAHPEDRAAPPIPQGESFRRTRSCRRDALLRSRHRPAMPHKRSNTVGSSGVLVTKSDLGHVSGCS